MKTAISLPDSVFREAELVAERIGVSRSELYTTALTEYLKRYNEEQITAQLNEIYAEESSALDPVIAKMQFMSIPREDWS